MDESTSSIITENSYSKETTITSDSEKSHKESYPKIIFSMANNLQEIIIENQQNFKDCFIRRDSFFCAHLPLISIQDYIKRIMKYSNMEMSTMIIAIIYIDLMCSKKKYIISMTNIYRLILAASLLSIKFNEDCPIVHSYYAQIGGVTGDLLKRLEYDFYILMDFTLVIDSSYYQRYYSYFSKFVKAKVGDNKTDNAD